VALARALSRFVGSADGGTKLCGLGGGAVMPPRQGVGKLALPTAQNGRLRSQRLS
jgi:hypothetical protein